MIANRRALAGASVALLVACASPGMPPGGPPDVAAPELLATTPDSNAVGVKAASVVLRFDEVVSERSGGGGAGGGTRGATATTGLDGLVLLSPGDGRERVQWRRTALEVEPRDGFRPNTTYRLTLLPGLGDLRGNATRTARELVFSTGDSLATGEITGAVFDWAAGRAAPRARVEAFQAADTTFRWRAVADSSGRFALRNLGGGAYLVRAWIDETANRTLDTREAFDSVTVALDARAANDFYVFSRDTIGVRIESAEPVDSTGIRVRFDRAVAPSWTPDAGSAFVQGADSARVAAGVLMPAAVFDSAARVRRAAADSVARADTLARPDTAPARPAAPPVARPAAAAVQPPAARADTLPAGPVFARPVPVREWVLPLATPLPPGEYRLTTVEVESLAGTRRTSERVFRVREPAAPAATDSAGPPPRRPPAP